VIGKLTERFFGMLGYTKTAPAPDPQEARMDGPSQLRRWDSAATTRLNQHQWTQVSQDSINFDLWSDLQTLVARCRYERQNNPLVSGVCDTYAIDVVGRRGPHLIIESDSEPYNNAAKEVWKEYFDELSVDGSSGVQMLRRLVPQLFDTGDWLHQKVDMSKELPANTAVTTRLLDIDPLRMWDPAAGVNSILGVERDRLGRPKKYWIRDDVQPGMLSTYSYKYRDFSADDIMHCYQEREPGQVRGFPALASCLQDLADLRDYDNQVLDAARAAANNGMLLYTTDATLIGDNAKPATGSIKLERQTAKYVTPGYQVGAQASTQPGAHYIEFRHERLRSLGRVAHMPLLMVLLSAEESNFSQSRIDLNVIYQRGINTTQQWIEEEWLNPLRKLCFREAMLAMKPGAIARDKSGFLLPPRPQKVSFRWGWEPIAQANPKDHLEVQAERIKWGLSAPQIEVSNEGNDEDEILDSLARTNEKRKKRGLPPLPGPGKPQQSSTEGTNDEATKTPSKSQPATARGQRSARRHKPVTS
jgi:lambda family phage portal protein